MITWYSVLLAVLILNGVFLGIVVLLQSGKGGGLAAMGGGAAATDGILGGRQATTMLTRATWTTGSIFMSLSLVLSIMSSRAPLSQSILRQDAVPTVEVGQSIVELLNQLGDSGDGSGDPIDGNGND